VTPNRFGARPSLCALLAALLGSGAAAEEQSTRTVGMEEVRMASEAEVLAASCGLRLNELLRDTLRNDSLRLLDKAAFESMEQFSRAYTLSLVRRHRRAICARALIQFGPEGEQVKGLLEQPRAR
jgi:hypothetical protein